MKRLWSVVDEIGDDGISDREMTAIAEAMMVCEGGDFLDDGDNVTEQDGGGGNTPLFEFQSAAVGRPQKFRNTLVKQRFQTRKTQLRDARPTDNLGEEITRSVARVANNILQQTGERWRNGVQNEDRVLFNFSTPKFQHPLQSAYFRVSEIEENSERWETYLQVNTLVYLE